MRDSLFAAFLITGIIYVSFKSALESKNENAPLWVIIGCTLLLGYIFNSRTMNLPPKCDVVERNIRFDTIQCPKRSYNYYID